MNETTPPDLLLRLAAAGDARCIGVLGAHVFLETYAPHGVRPLIANEVLEHFSPDAISRSLRQQARVLWLTAWVGNLRAQDGLRLPVRMKTGSS